MFDPTADPESLAARAAEYALEQTDRLRGFLKHHPDNGADFYKEPFEISVSNQIARWLCAYAALKGYVSYEQAGITEVRPPHSCSVHTPADACEDRDCLWHRDVPAANRSPHFHRF